MSEKLSAEERTNAPEEATSTPFLHRIIGSAVIIGLAVVVFSWLLGTPSRTVSPPEEEVAQQQQEEQEDVFISRIVPPEEVKTIEPAVSSFEIEAEGVEQSDSINSPKNDVPTPLKTTEQPVLPVGGESSSAEVAKAEPQPEQTPKPVETDEPARKIAIDPPVKQETAAVEPAPAPKNDETSTSDASFNNVSGWVVQMGAYSKLPGANATVDQLKDKQIVAKINKSSDNNKTIYRVFVGPFKNRAAAEDASQQIAKRTNMKPFVRKQ